LAYDLQAHGAGRKTIRPAIPGDVVRLIREHECACDRRGALLLGGVSRGR
jgi:hypothetical protein